MFELSSKATEAGSKVAIEWVKLETLGFDPASVIDKPVEQLTDPELNYLRAYQHFEIVARECNERGVPLPLRYATFHAAGGTSNPGVLPPTVPLLALLLLILALALICLKAIDLGAAELPFIAFFAGVVVLGWDRVWTFCEYLTARWKR